MFYNIQIWTAVECNGATYWTVVTSYKPKAKITPETIFPRGPLGPREIWGFQE